jgi:hypothetical protein
MSNSYEREAVVEHHSDDKTTPYMDEVFWEETTTGTQKHEGNKQWWA